MSRKHHQHEAKEIDLTLCKDFQQLTKDEFFKMTKKERKLYNSIANMHNLPIYRRDS
jgi:ribosomal protein S2